MQELPGAPSTATLLRWATFILAAANTMVIISFGRLQDFATVMEKAGSPVATLGPSVVVALPAALLAGAFMVFYLVALWPRRRHVPIYTQLVLPTVASFLLAAAFVTALRLQKYGLSLFLLAAGWIVSVVMFVMVASVSPSRHSRWLRVPFSLYLATVTAATIAASSYWLERSEIRLFDIDVALLALPMGAALVVAIGGALAIRYQEFVYLLVVATIAAVIAATAWRNDPGAFADIVVVCVGVLVMSLLAAFASARVPRDRRSSSDRYALELPGESAASDTGPQAPAEAPRNPKVAKARRAASKSPGWQPTAGNPDTGPFQGPITIT